MAPVKKLHYKCYKGGKVDGIHVKWSKKAEARLKDEADNWGIHISVLKGWTEDVVLRTAKAIKSDKASIMAPFHSFTTDTKTHELKKDQTHCTVNIEGSTTAHIYVNKNLANMAPDKPLKILKATRLDDQSEIEEIVVT